ncbi:MAG: pilus assembly protein [Fimbriimonadaceae bacterium]|nr:pilus assembly protein [Fimbriimonadaceae bacterium]
MRAARRRRGQAVLETTVVAMFLVILVLGIIGLGTILSASIRLETAAREGARIATEGGDNTNICNKVLLNLGRNNDVNQVPGTVAISIYPNDITQRTFNSQVKVEVWWKYPIPVAMFNILVKERMLYARKVMVVTHAAN